MRRLPPCAIMLRQLNCPSATITSSARSAASAVCQPTRYKPCSIQNAAIHELGPLPETRLARSALTTAAPMPGTSDSLTAPAIIGKMILWIAW